MRLPITAASIREILVREDPLATWPAAKPDPDGYEQTAEMAASGLQNMLGLGHARTVVADAIDRRQPGFYQALRAGDPELGRRMGRVAHEIWDRHGVLIPRPPRSPGPDPGAIPEPTPTAVLIARPDVLEAWLRSMEAGLDAEGALPPPQRHFGPVLQAALPGLVDGYLAASDGEREAARLAFSRFQRCCHQLSGFAGRQHAGLEGPDPAGALRQALAAESLLDLHLDWRDELLLVQALKRRAELLNLPYAELLEMAAARSSTLTADFLRKA